MKKLYYKLLLFAVVAAVAAPFIIRDPDGRPLMSVDQLKMPRLATPDLPDVGRLVGQAKDGLRLGEDRDQRRTTTVFKWRDADGVWHFSDEAVAGGAPVEPVELDPDANLVRHEPPKEQRVPSASGSSSGPEPGAPPSGGLPLTRTPELVERARQVDQLLTDRHTRQQRALDQL